MISLPYLYCLGASQECVCNTILDPYCCDNKDFDNSCMAQCNGFTDVERDCDKGICDYVCHCAFEWYPVCCDDTTYYNPWFAECYGILKSAEQNRSCKPCVASCSGGIIDPFKCSAGTC